MAQQLMIANWKMNKTHDQAKDYMDILAQERLPSQVEVVICPPFTALGAVAAGAKASLSMVGAQNCSWAASGALTGEISPEMLVALTVKYVLVGHSERRSLFGESDDIVARKVQLLLQSALIPVLCLGETEQERDGNLTEEVLRRQLDAALPLTSDEASKIVIAYEPVWAIGTSRTANGEQVTAAMQLIRHYLATKYTAATAEAIPILYGGSVNLGNIASLAECPIDGALVGGASLNPQDFANLTRSFAVAKEL